MRALSILAFLCAGMAHAQVPFDEDALFADTAIIVDSVKLVGNRVMTEEFDEKKSIGFSGNILSIGSAGLKQKYFASPDIRHTYLNTWMTGDFMLDIRLFHGFKAFSNLELAYDPFRKSRSGTDSSLDISLPEMFIDANIRNKVYFRTGKQVLQWGRCYFFNPTDMLNIEKKSFFRRIGNREGAYGLKMHIPFGTRWNIYGFAAPLDNGAMDHAQGALKLEALFGGTEMALMAWDADQAYPVYGLDVSSRALGIDITGEVSLHRRYKGWRLSSSPDALMGFEPVEKDWLPRACIGLSRFFRAGGIKDRLMTVMEYYYNHAGSSAERIRIPSSGAFPDAGGMELSADEAVRMMQEAGVYEPNNLSHHYLALFATFSRFLTTDMSLMFNALGNLDQKCAMISSGLIYNNINDFSLNLNVNGFAGPERTEYTFSQQALQAQVIAEVKF